MNSKGLLKIKDLYFEKWIDRSELDKITQRVADEISRDYADKNPLFIGILNGAFIWTGDLVRKINFYDMEVEWTKVSSYEGEKSTGIVKQLIGLKVPIKDRHVIIVEDIVDSGKTMSEVLPSLQKEGPASLELASLFYKKCNCKYDIPIKYVGMEIPDKFILGYGLDYDEAARNLPDIWVKYDGDVSELENKNEANPQQ